MSGASQENHLRILNQVFKLANSEAIALMLAAKNAEEVIAILSRF
jgi:mannitol/fructose-specific phosphotransferase system IIA component (Ntr-type)